MKHRIFSTLLAAVMTCSIAAPPIAAAAASAPLYTASIAETPLAKSEVTESSVYAAITEMEAEYPTGTTWTNDNSYAWKGGIYGEGYGCAGFAFMMSDAAFGDLPARMVETFDPSTVRVGDILRYSNHSVVVLEMKENSFIATEGNISSMVYWGREILFSDMDGTFEHHITRYPETQDEPTTEPIDLKFDAVVEITEMPVRTMYALNNTLYTKDEVLDLTGLRVNVYHKYLGWQETVYENVNPLDYPEAFTISGFDAATVGEQEITLTYGTFNHELNEDVRTSVSFPIQMLDLTTKEYMNERCTARLELQALPEKLEYALNEPLDLTGIRVLVERYYAEKKYRSPYDAEKLNASEEFTIFGYDPSKAGEQEVMLVYDYFNQEWNEDVSCAVTFNVTVKSADEADTLGDINRDSKADASDAAMILTAAAADGAGSDTGLDAAQIADMDVDFDGDFDAADAAIVLTYAAYTGSGGTLGLRDYLKEANEV